MYTFRPPANRNLPRTHGRTGSSRARAPAAAGTLGTVMLAILRGLLGDASNRHGDGLFGTVPAPCRFDDFGEIHELGFPSENARGALRVGHQDGGIAGTPGALRKRYAVARKPFHRAPHV